MRLKTYIAATQRGYVYGLVDSDGTRYIERNVRANSFSAEDIDKAYRFASVAVSNMAQTLKRKPRLLRLRKMPGRMYG